MASFLALMSRIFMPPFLWFSDSRDVEIGGGESEFHRKVRILLLRRSSYLLGIPCAAVMNWVLPPIVICIICFLPSRLGKALFHWLKLPLISFMIFGHGSFLDTWLLSCVPRHLIVSPSLRMWIELSKVKSNVCFIFLDSLMLFL